MPKIYFKERSTGELKEEKVYGRVYLALLYSSHTLLNKLARPFLWFVAHLPYFSRLYGYLQKLPSSQSKVEPFIKHYGVDTKEFLDDVKSFKSFNDFFIRKLKPSARPFSHDPKKAILPADARYLVFSNVDEINHIFVKGEKLSLVKFLQSKELAAKYKSGSLVMARLCPTDYHRYHFPFACTPSKSKLINGLLYSVNPLALSTHLKILSENKRVITTLHSPVFGEVLYIAIGATNVGSIQNTFTPEKHVEKGDEKGYFEFGGSCIVLLFQKDKIELDTDLVSNSHEGFETKALFGQSLGQSK